MRENLFSIVTPKRINDCTTSMSTEPIRNELGKIMRVRLDVPGAEDILLEMNIDFVLDQLMPSLLRLHHFTMPTWIFKH